MPVNLKAPSYRALIAVLGEVNSLDYCFAAHRLHRPPGQRFGDQMDYDKELSRLVTMLNPEPLDRDFPDPEETVEEYRRAHTLWFWDLWLGYDHWHWERTKENGHSN